MEIAFYTILFFVSAVVLAYAGTWFVRALARVSRILGWSEFAAAFIILAFASSLPEFFIGISSALHGIPQISFGNILGANVIHFTVAIGLAAFFAKGIGAERKIIRRDAIIALAAAMLPLLLVVDGTLSRGDGILLLVAFVFYFRWLFLQKERFAKPFNHNAEIFKAKKFFTSLGILLASAFSIVVSADFIVRAGVFFAERIAIPPALVSILIIGAGTALPETYFAIQAALKGKKDVILGDLLGAVIITALFVLGIVALISPIVISDFTPYAVARIFLLIGGFLFWIFLRTNEYLSRPEALILIGVYGLFVLTQILLVSLRG